MINTCNSQVNINDMYKAIRSITRSGTFDTIVTHPGNLKLLLEKIKRIYDISTLYGIEVIQDRNMPRYGQKWEFPTTPFVEYSQSDEKWAIPVKFGRWVDDTSNILFYGLNTQAYKWDQILKGSI